jgi:CRP-like cAMP-binding protein
MKISKEFITKILGNDIENIDEIISKFTSIRAKRKEVLLEQGDKCELVYFIVKGAIQIYTLDKDMNEVTREIVVEDTWFSDLQSFSTGTPSTETIRTLEPTILIAINHNDFEFMMQKTPKFYLVYKGILEKNYENSVERVKTLMNLNATERILWLKKTKPTYFKRFPNKLLASYLNINKDVFSRIYTKI